MAISQFKIDGLKECMKAFDEADKACVKALRKAVKDSAKPVLADAKNNVKPSADGSHGKPPGTLKRDLTIKAEKTPDKAKYVVRVGLKSRKTAKAVDENGTPYGVFVEYGTSKTPAQPFLKPALESTRGETEDRIADTIMAAIIK